MISILERWPAIVRVLGAVGFLHELLVADAERPYILALIGIMMGVAEISDALLRGDIKIVRRKNGT
jgi:hypothetical protein